MTDPSPSNEPPAILIAYDGSQSARRAVARAAELFPGAQATVVTAWMGVAEASPELMLAPGGVLLATAGAFSDVMQERAQELAAEGARLAAADGLQAAPRAIRTARAHWEAIVAFADESDADVVVLGSRGHSAIAAAVLGSVSTGVLHHSSRPVLIVPDRDE